MPVYEYEGKHYDLPDGLTNEQAIAKIETHLGKPAQQIPQPQQQRGLGAEALRQVGLTARAGSNAVAGVPLMVGDFVNSGINLASQAVGGPALLRNPSEVFQQGLTAAGLPEPETGLERAVQAGATGVGSVGVQAKLAGQAGGEALKALSQNIPQQAAAAGVGGTAAQATGEAVGVDLESPLAGTVAALAVGIGTGGLAAKTVGGKPPKPASLQEVKQRATAQYQAMEDAGVALKPQPIYKMLDDAETELLKDNFNPLMDTHRPVKQVLDQLRGMVEDKRVSFPKLEQMRSAATALKASKDSATRAYAGKLVTVIDDFIGNIEPKDVITGKAKTGEAVKSVIEARRDWRNMSRAQVLEDALNTAEARALDPKSSEHELIRRQLINLLADKRKIRFFSKREVNAIESVAKGGNTDPILSLIARFNPERSQLMAGGQLVAATQSPTGAVVTGGSGWAADKILGLKRSREMRNLISGIADGQPPQVTPNFGWRGLLAAPTQPITEDELELLRGLR